MVTYFDQATLHPRSKHKKVTKIAGEKRKRQKDKFGKYCRKCTLLQDDLQSV